MSCAYLIVDMKIEEYISDFKTGTVILTVSGLVVGVMMAAADYSINWVAALCLILSVVCLQTLTTVIPGIVLAVATAWISYGTVLSLEALIMLLLGYFVYRLASNHYPEQGLYRNGIVVTLTSLLIYGILPVFGAYFVCAHSFGSRMLLLPALSVGSLCLASVNSAYVGESRTRAFHTLWVIAGIALMTAYACLRIFDPWHFIFVLVVPLFVLWLVRIWTGSPKVTAYERILPLMILAFSVLSGLGFIIYLI